MRKKAIVVGAGIVGLATARSLALSKYDVTVIERSERAMGASVRNFGMIWPVGQPDGQLYERAMRSVSAWKAVCRGTSTWSDECGSLHVANNVLEWQVLQELAEVYRGRGYRLLDANGVQQISSCVVANDLLGGLYSPHELIVDPREAILKIPGYLRETLGVNFLFGKTVIEVSYPSVLTADEELQADEIYICSGADFETLYPSFFASLPVTKCKLQMMRMVAQKPGYRIGPALCGGLSLTHYKSFEASESLYLLKNYYREAIPDYLEWGIHVMVAQNEIGELTIGDSHEYGSAHDPFDRHFINRMILEYLATFARFENETIKETWNGVYPKLTNGETDLVLEPEEGVTIINCLGGAGMTLSFGLCEEIVSKKLNGVSVAQSTVSVVTPIKN